MCLPKAKQAGAFPFANDALRGAGFHLKHNATSACRVRGRATSMHRALLFARRHALAGCAAGAAAAAAYAADLPAACKGAKNDRETVVGTTKFLQLITLDYTDDKGVARKWDMAQRMGKPSVVSVLPILHSKSFKPGEEETLITCQYRPPLGAYCIEMPAAIVMPGENIEQAALRTITTETGYENAKVRTLTTAAAPSAGLTSERVSIAVVDIDLDEYTTEGQSITYHVRP